jgi:hypothetical protein
MTGVSVPSTRFANLDAISAVAIATRRISTATNTAAQEDRHAQPAHNARMRRPKISSPPTPQKSQIHLLHLPPVPKAPHLYHHQPIPHLHHCSNISSKKEKKNTPTTHHPPNPQTNSSHNTRKSIFNLVLSSQKNHDSDHPPNPQQLPPQWREKKQNLLAPAHDPNPLLTAQRSYHQPPPLLLTCTSARQKWQFWEETKMQPNPAREGSRESGQQAKQEQKQGSGVCNGGESGMCRNLRQWRCL